jgi:UDP-perosamine 4-acetyltransferase
VTQTKPIVIVGGGGHAAVLAETAIAAGRTLAGYTAPEASAQPIAPYLGDDAKLEAQHVPGSVELLIGVGSTAPTRRREELFRAFAARGYSFATIVHPRAHVSPSAILHPGVQILAGCIVQTGAVIAENVILNTGASVDHDSTVGAHAHIAPGALLCGGVTVGERAHVGAGAVVIQNVRIPDDGFVRAGEVVRHA